MDIVWDLNRFSVTEDKPFRSKFEFSSRDHVANDLNRKQRVAAGTVFDLVGQPPIKVEEIPHQTVDLDLGQGLQV